MTDLKALADRLREIHTPFESEVEVWSDGPGEEMHDELFPECDAERCEGHTITIPVCNECGYDHDGDQLLLRRWPCPRCGGSGYQAAFLDQLPDGATCQRCNGTGTARASSEASVAALADRFRRFHGTAEDRDRIAAILDHLAAAPGRLPDEFDWDGRSESGWVEWIDGLADLTGEPMTPPDDGPVGG